MRDMALLQKKAGERVLEQLKNNITFQLATHGKKPKKIALWSHDYDAVKSILEPNENGELEYEGVKLERLSKTSTQPEGQGMVFVSEAKERGKKK